MTRVRNGAIVREAKRLKPYCKRCYSTGSLCAHHIVALADGGEDSLENVDVLCGRCHNEWHNHAEGLISYKDFLGTVPAHILLKSQVNKLLKTASLERLVEDWRFARDHLRTPPPSPDQVREVFGADLSDKDAHRLLRIMKGLEDGSWPVLARP